MIDHSPVLLLTIKSNHIHTPAQSSAACAQGGRLWGGRLRGGRLRGGRLWGGRLWGGRGRVRACVRARMVCLGGALGAQVDFIRFVKKMDPQFQANLSNVLRVRTESSLPELSSGSPGSPGSSQSGTDHMRVYGSVGCMYAVVGCKSVEMFGCKVCGCWVQVS